MTEIDMTLNPDASEYIPIAKSTLGLLYPSATPMTAGFHVSPPSAALPPFPFPCLQVPPQGLIQPPLPSPSPCLTYFWSPSPLLPPPSQPTDVEPTSDQLQCIIPFAAKEKAELFPRVITGKKFIPNKNYPRSWRCSSSSRGGFWSSGRKRWGRGRGRPRLMPANSRGMKPKDNESCDLKKHDVLPLSHNDEEKTTVMIKNIPYEITRLNLVEFLDKYCMEENREANKEDETPNPTAYDFLYLPIDFEKKKNKGYAFVNFTESRAVWKFFNAFNSTKWDFNNSSKIRIIVCAKIQGKEALVDHFKKTYFDCESEEYLPACFSPPRDGSSASVVLTTVGRRRSEGQFRV